MVLTFISQELRVSWAVKVIGECTTPLWAQPGDVQELIYLPKGANSSMLVLSSVTDDYLTLLRKKLTTFFFPKRVIYLLTIKLLLQQLPLFPL